MHKRPSERPKKGLESLWLEEGTNGEESETQIWSQRGSGMRDRAGSYPSWCHLSICCESSIDSREDEGAGLRTQEGGTEGQLDTEIGRRKKTNQVTRNSGGMQMSKGLGTTDAPHREG